jgi:Fe-Mn family superoxide dismutase
VPFISFIPAHAHKLTKSPFVFLYPAHTPIIGVDIWEHAFYLQYKNVKPDVRVSPRAPRYSSRESKAFDVLAYHNRELTPLLFVQYLNAIWNVINFEEAERRYLDAHK